jgi:hypothetical protein
MDSLELNGTSANYSTCFVIGRQCLAFKPKRSGTLWCFANDVPVMYWNNSGSIKLTIKRTM